MIQTINTKRNKSNPLLNDIFNGLAKSHPLSSKISGRYFTTGFITDLTALSTTTPSGDFLRAIPIFLSEPAPISAIGAYINTGAASTNIRFGIYTDSGANYPYRLISGSDRGDVSSASAGWKESLVDMVIPPGMSYLVYNFTVGAQTIYGYTTNAFADYYGTDNAYTRGTSLRAAYSYGAMPDIFPSGAIYRFETVPVPLLKYK